LASDFVRELVDSGIHFGHRASRWNPKMAPYIFGKRNTIHIIDVRETLKGLVRAKKFISQTVARGKDILFVGTKRQARGPIKVYATRVGMPYVSERWLGGTLTNFRTVRSRLARLEELEKAEIDGSAQEYSKKMIATRTRELNKIRRNLEGIRNMDKLPGAMVVVDVHRERNAVREAKKLGIPTVCLIDTDSDPDFADLPIPGNDDAIRAIDTVLAHLTDAVELGKKARAAEDAAEAERRRSEPPRRGPAPGGAAQPAREDGASPESKEQRNGSEPPAKRRMSDSSRNEEAGLTAATATERDRPS
jgi:small subunit ribosomal protein S2